MSVGDRDPLEVSATEAERQLAVGLARTLSHYGLSCQAVGRDAAGVPDLWIVAFPPREAGGPTRLVLLNGSCEYWHAEAFGFRPKVTNGGTFKLDLLTDVKQERERGRSHIGTYEDYGRILGAWVLEHLAHQLFSRNERTRQRRRQRGV